MDNKHLSLTCLSMMYRARANPILCYGRLECNHIELKIAPILVKVIQVGGGWELPAVGVGGSCRERVALVAALAAQQLSHSSVGWLLAGAGRHHLCRETGVCRESAISPIL